MAYEENEKFDKSAWDEKTRTEVMKNDLFMWVATLEFQVLLLFLLKTKGKKKRMKVTI